MTIAARALDTAESDTTRRRRLLPDAVIAVLVIVLGLTGAYLVGYRLNLTTSHVTAPTPDASPEQVVAAYVDAYNHRDWTTMAQIYPGHSFDRHRAIGTMSDLTIVESQPATGTESGTPAEPGHSYYRVQVSLDYSGLTSSDLAYEPGPNGWTYTLERNNSNEPWYIASHGNF